MLAFGLGTLLWRARHGRFAADAAEARPPPPARLREMAQGEGFDIAEVDRDGHWPAEPPPVLLAAAPIVLVVALNGLFPGVILPALDAAQPADPRFGGADPAKLRGLWAIMLALSATIVLTVLANLRRLPRLTETLGAGANAAAIPALNTAVLVGFGAVIASLPALGLVRDAVLGIAPGNPFISLSIAVNVLAGITGSASGGLSIALATMGATSLARALAAGIPPELLHRVSAIATGGLDALPHNGAVVPLLAVCRLTRRESCADIVAVACAGPIPALVVVLVLAGRFGAFRAAPPPRHAAGQMDQT
jgi:H+/gluconate symporter-like permease